MPKRDASLEQAQVTQIDSDEQGWDKYRATIPGKGTFFVLTRVERPGEPIEVAGRRMIHFHDKRVICRGLDEAGNALSWDDLNGLVDHIERLVALKLS